MLSKLILICVAIITGTSSLRAGTYTNPILKVKVEDFPGNRLLKILFITIRTEKSDSLYYLSVSFDDKSTGSDTRFDLLTNKGIIGKNNSISITKNMFRDYKLYYVFPPFVAGTNNISVSGMVSRNKTAFQIADRCSFEFNLLPGTGLIKGPDGKVGRTFELNGIPIFANITYDNEIDIFKDADHDGLLDSWENFALEILRPYLAFNPNEEYLRDSKAGLLIFSRISPYQDSKGTTARYIVFRSVVTFSKDYGDGLGLGSHNGDTQEYISYWKIEGLNKIYLIKLQMVRHTGSLIPSAPMTEFDPETQYKRSNGTPYLFVENGKHGLWPNNNMCNEQSKYECEWDYNTSHVKRPDAFNVGEPENPFMDKLNTSDISITGPHKKAYNIFNGESIWLITNFMGGRGNDGTGSTSIGQLLRASETTIMDGSRVVNPNLINKQMNDVNPVNVTFR